MKKPLYPKAELAVRDETDCRGKERGPVFKSTIRSGPNTFTNLRLNSPSAAKRTESQYPNFSITISLRNIRDDIFEKIYVPGVPRRCNIISSVSLSCSEVVVII